MKKKLNVRRMTELALLTAIVLLMAFTPLGYLMTPWGVQISFIVIPVAVGGIVLGPSAGAFLGLVFGLSSFIRAFQTASGILMLEINPVGVFLCSVPTRVLVGWITGLLYRAMRKRPGLRTVGQAVCCALTPIANTVLYMTANWLLFADTWLDMVSAAGFENVSGLGLLGAMFAMVSVNAIAEVIVCLVIGTAISKALIHTLHRGE